MALRNLDDQIWLELEGGRDNRPAAAPTGWAWHTWAELGFIAGFILFVVLI